MDYGRVITAMVTPFDEKLQIDWDRTGQLIDYLIEEQASESLVVCGTTGESAALTDEEKLELMAFCVQQAQGRCKIIAGTGSNDTAHSIHLTKKAEQAGVDGILLVAPYYNRPNQEGLFRHFSTVARSTDLPVMLYNIPKRTGINVEAETVIRLAEIPNVTSLKEANNNFDQICKILDGTTEHFRLYSGDDDLTLPMLSVGAYGIVSVASHVIGKEIRSMIDAHVDGRVGEAARLHRQLLPVLTGLFVCPNPSAVKYALHHKGLDVGGVRLPLADPSEDEMAFIRSLF